MLYACILGVVRFLEGISWGYSVFLMHQQLDLDNILAVKVLINHMMRLKQHFRENAEFKTTFQNDKLAVYNTDYFFKGKNRNGPLTVVGSLSYASLEKLFTDREVRSSPFNKFLSN